MRNIDVSIHLFLKKTHGSTRRCSSFFRDQVIVIVIVTLRVIVIVIATLTVIVIVT